MAKRKEKRVKKYRGHRTHGGGNIKNRRGSGNRGGVGHAGLNKQKKTWTVKFAPNYFGNSGFVNPNREEPATMNVFEIENMARKGTLENKAGKLSLTFEGKVLGAGDITVPVSVKAGSWSKKAEDKIKQAGGSIEKIAAAS
ncbi:50S ribosomal protein L15 [uncultured archaeon]|nr:50S ribosomal protein L15 [uncultured archaeon]